MRKLFLINLFIISYVFGFSQNCYISSVKDVKKITFENRTFVNPAGSIKKFDKMKESKQEIELEKIRNDIKNGAVKSNATEYDYYIDSVVVNDDGQSLYSTMKAGETITTKLEFCMNDTLYLTVLPVLGKYNNKIMSIYLAGVQRIPLNIKVGDVLPPYEDYMITPSSTRTFSDWDMVFSHNVSSSHTEIGFNVDTDGKSKFGKWRVYESKAVYKKMNVEVKETAQSKSHFINYAVSIVSGKEEIIFNGKKYTAFVIDSEKWIKSRIETSFESESKAVEKRHTEFNKKLQNRIEKKLRKTNFVNDLGYQETAVREWFVPDLGIIKTVTYDNYGIGTMVWSLKSIE